MSGAVKDGHIGNAAKQVLVLGMVRRTATAAAIGGRTCIGALSFVLLVAYTALFLFGWHGPSDGGIKKLVVYSIAIRLLQRVFPLMMLTGALSVFSVV